MSRRRKKNKSKTERPQVENRRKRFSWKRLIALPIVLVILLLMAPMIICNSPMINWIVNYSTSDMKGQVTIESVKAGWFSKLRLNHVTILDSQQREIGSIKSITGSKTLFQIVSNPTELGEFSVDQPNLTVVLDGSSSNWETAFSEFLKPSDEKSSPLPKVEVQIFDGSIQLKHIDSEQVCSFSAVQATARIGVEASQDISFTLQGTPSENAAIGKFEVSAAYSPNTESAEKFGSCKLTTTRFPLVALQPVLARWLPSIQLLQGQTSGTLEANWSRSDDNFRATAKSDFDFGDVTLEESSLQPDRLEFESLRVHADIELSDSMLDIKEFNIDSSLGNVSLNGTANPNRLLTHSSLVSLMTTLKSSRAKFAGEVDLSKVMAMLPHRLKIRDDASLKSGQFSWNLDTVGNETNQTKITGFMKTSDVVAIGGGKRMRWNSPLRAEFDVDLHDGSFFVNRLSGQSTFFSFIANGTDSNGTFAAQADLSRFQKQFDQLFDFSGTTFNGRLQCNLRWQTGHDEFREIAGRIATSDLNIKMASRPPISEPSVIADFSTTVRLGQITPEEVQKATARIAIGDNLLDVSLTDKVVDISSRSTWPLSVSIQGELELWHRLAQPFVPITGLDIAGGVDFHGQLVTSNQRLEIKSTKGTFTGMRARWNDLKFTEREARLSIDAVVDFETSEVEINNSTIVADGLQAKTEHLIVGYARNQPKANGQVEVSGQLGRFESLLTSEHGSSRRLDGTFAADLIFQQAAAGFAFSIDSTLEKPRLLMADTRRPNSRSVDWQEIWSEPQVGISAKGGYDTEKETLQLTEARVESASVSVSSHGIIQQLSSNPVADLQGETTYDLNTLSSRFKNYLGSNFRIQGKETRPFVLRGPLSEITEKTATMRNVSLSSHPSSSFVPKDLFAQTGIGWQSAYIYGLELNESRLDAKLQDRIVEFAPLQTTVGSGQLLIQPQIDLRSATPLLTHGEGRVLENVQITPEMCRTWFRYIAPLLADSTQAEGAFSIDLSGAEVPLTDPQRGRAAGRLLISQGRLGAGPLANQFLSVAQQIKGLLRGGAASRIVDPDRAWVSLPEQAVVFEMREGQIGHKGLKMDLGEVSVETEGWVTLDEQLALNAKVPIRDEWIQESRLLSGLQGQVLDLPVRGTFDRPQLDRAALGKLTQQAVTGAAEGLLKQEFDKQLKRLFK